MMLGRHAFSSLVCEGSRQTHARSVSLLSAAVLDYREPSAHNNQLSTYVPKAMLHIMFWHDIGVSN